MLLTLQVKILCRRKQKPTRCGQLPAQARHQRIPVGGAHAAFSGQRLCLAAERPSQDCLARTPADQIRVLAVAKWSAVPAATVAPGEAVGQGYGRVPEEKAGTCLCGAALLHDRAAALQAAHSGLHGCCCKVRRLPLCHASVNWCMGKKGHRLSHPCTRLAPSCLLPPC